MLYRVVLLSVFLACNIPSRMDVEDAVGNATDTCREIVFDAVPQIIGAAASACSALDDRFSEAEDAVTRSVLEGLGCSQVGEDGAKKWRCSGSIVCN